MKLPFFALQFLHILDITLQRLSLFLNSEINFSVAPWSSFYVFKDILYTKQPFTDIFKIGILKNLKAFNFIKKRPQHRCFPVNIAKFLRTAFFIEHLRWLLLHLIKLYIFKLKTQAIQFEIVNCCLHEYRSSCPEVFYKKGEGCNFIKKETLAQVFSCEFCKISKNTLP